MGAIVAAEDFRTLAFGQRTPLTKSNPCERYTTEQVAGGCFPTPRWLCLCANALFVDSSGSPVAFDRTSPRGGKLSAHPQLASAVG